MNDEQKQDCLDAMLYRALVPLGFRPTSDTNIEKLLDTIDVESMSDVKLQRMLRKINGDAPMFAKPTHPTQELFAELTTEERELVKLHRGKNQPLPPDLAEKIRAMEERARRDTDGEVATHDE